MGHEIPRTHPRYHSLVVRERLVEGFSRGLVVPQGLIAHGRGEAFDYILGEKTHDFAVEAARAAVAMMMASRHPIVSVNGNYAVLAGRYIVELSEVTGAWIEVNLFHRTSERVRLISEYLRSLGAKRLFDHRCETTRLPGLESPRGIVCIEGIYRADFVLVAIEDGDRTEALIRNGKKVAAIDLNPFSRTAQTATITIVDEAIRATKVMVDEAKRLSSLKPDELSDIVRSYDNKEVLRKAFKAMLERLSFFASKGVIVDLDSRGS